MANTSASRAVPWRDAGFTLVELMIVVFIIGVLVTIALPVYSSGRMQAQAKACQANQRTLLGAIETMRSQGTDTSAASAGVLDAGGSGWYAILVAPVTGSPWVKGKPTCPEDGADYYMDAPGNITGDRGATAGFKTDHALY